MIKFVIQVFNQKDEADEYAGILSAGGYIPNCFFCEKVTLGDNSYDNVWVVEARK